MAKDREKAKRARFELLKMALENKEVSDTYLESSKKQRDKSKEKVIADEKREPKRGPLKVRKESSFSKELKQVSPEFVHGVKREFNKIKSLFKKDKNDE